MKITNLLAGIFVVFIYILFLGMFTVSFKDTNNKIQYRIEGWIEYLFKKING